MRRTSRNAGAANKYPHCVSDTAWIVISGVGTVGTPLKEGAKRTWVWPTKRGLRHWFARPCL